MGRTRCLRKPSKRLEDERRARPIPKPKENFYGNSDKYMTKAEDEIAKFRTFFVARILPRHELRNARLFQGRWARIIIVSRK